MCTSCASYDDILQKAAVSDNACVCVTSISLGVICSALICIYVCVCAIVIVCVLMCTDGAVLVEL